LSRAGYTNVTGVTDPREVVLFHEMCDLDLYLLDRRVARLRRSHLRTTPTSQKAWLRSLRRRAQGFGRQG
jgi:hypothetical protein